MVKLNKTTKLLAAVLTVGTLLGGCVSSAPTHESTGQYIDSSGITMKVKAQLLADDNVKSFPITVNTYKSTVQLSGFVDNYAQKARAGQIARSVEGVTAVDNQLRIKHLRK